MTSTPSDRAVRRAVRVALSGVLLTLIGAGAFLSPAGANTPEGWSNPDPVDPIHFLLVLVGAPLALILVIAIFVYVPALVRGESVSPSHAGAFEIEWFGGPRKSHDELAAPDDEESQSGGASGRW